MKADWNSNEQEDVELRGVKPANVRSAPLLADKRKFDADALDAHHPFMFGTPPVTQLSDGTIVVAFEVTEEFVTCVRCCRMMGGSRPTG